MLALLPVNTTKIEPRSFRFVGHCSTTWANTPARFRENLRNLWHPPRQQNELFAAGICASEQFLWIKVLMFLQKRLFSRFSTAVTNLVVATNSSFGEREKIAFEFDQLKSSHAILEHDTLKEKTFIPFLGGVGWRFRSARVESFAPYYDVHWCIL